LTIDELRLLISDLEENLIQLAGENISSFKNPKSTIVTRQSTPSSTAIRVPVRHSKMWLGQSVPVQRRKVTECIS
jgi:hypothetical protein